MMKKKLIRYILLLFSTFYILYSLFFRITIFTLFNFYSFDSTEGNEGWYPLVIKNPFKINNLYNKIDEYTNSNYKTIQYRKFQCDTTLLNPPDSMFQTKSLKEEYIKSETKICQNSMSKNFFITEGYKIMSIKNEKDSHFVLITFKESLDDIVFVFDEKFERIINVLY